MKKLFLSLFAILLTILSSAQSAAVDALFNKYSEMEGFTVVSISGRMFSMFADKETENKDADNIISKLKSIKILTVQDSLLNKNINFYTEISKKLNISEYEELMVVKEGRDITKFLIRQKGDLITELIVITGGPGGNSLISINGEFNLKNLSQLSKDIGMDELQGLEKIDDKNKIPVKKE